MFGLPAGPLLKWICIALAVAAVLGGVYAKGRADSTAAWKPKVAAVKADLEQCRDNNATLQTSINRQNAAVTALKVESDRRAEAGEKAAQEAQRAAVAASTRSASILAQKPGPDACKSAFDLVRSTVR